MKKTLISAFMVSILCLNAYGASIVSQLGSDPSQFKTLFSQGAATYKVLKNPVADQQGGYETVIWITYSTPQNYVLGQPGVYTMKQHYTQAALRIDFMCNQNLWDLRQMALANESDGMITTMIQPDHSWFYHNVSEDVIKKVGISVCNY